ncbi:MAG: hypothetical protein R2795_10285 [Saprospiraceae bacterium]
MPTGRDSLGNKVADDASGAQWVNQHQMAIPVEGVTWSFLPQNIGRARIRNWLAERANYEYLLFLDCDSGIPDAHFIERYLLHLAPDTVICGGRTYLPTPPNDNTYLHWYYGSQREVRNSSGKIPAAL